jgi:L-ribulose-5-phosphate 3-epimerase
MRSEMDRRHFLKASAAVGAGIGLAGLDRFRLLAADTTSVTPNADKLGWRLGIQTWTFHKSSTLFESIDKTASLGLKYIEAYHGQPLNKNHPTERYRFDMPDNLRTALKNKLTDSGVKLLGHFEHSENPSREVFEYCKDMGVEMITGEFAKDKLDGLDKLCQEYQIYLLMANHPKPTWYWNPNTVMEVCQGHSKWIGTSGDIGHWVREGLDPMACIKKLEGRLQGFHFRDMNKVGPGARDAHDVPWGTGVCDVRAMLTEVHRQGIKPVFMIEYEYHEDNSLPELAQCFKFFDQVAGELVAKGTTGIN